MSATAYLPLTRSRAHRRRSERRLSRVTFGAGPQAVVPGILAFAVGSIGRFDGTLALTRQEAYLLYPPGEVLMIELKDDLQSTVLPSQNIRCRALLND